MAYFLRPRITIIDCFLSVSLSACTEEFSKHGNDIEGIETAIKSRLKPWVGCLKTFRKLRPGFQPSAHILS